MLSTRSNFCAIFIQNKILQIKGISFLQTPTPSSANGTVLFIYSKINKTEDV